jgi:hypothetical protein
MRARPRVLCAVTSAETLLDCAMTLEQCAILSAASFEFRHRCMDLAYTACVVLTRLPQPPKRNSNLIWVGPSSGRLEVGVGRRNNIVQLRQFRGSADRDFVGKVSPIAVETRALRCGGMPADATEPVRRDRAQQNANTHLATPSSHVR